MTAAQRRARFAWALTALTAVAAAAPHGTAAQAAAPDALPVDPGTAFRLRALETDLHFVAMRSGSRLMSGITDLAGGAISVALGVYVQTETDYDRSLPVFLYVFGGVSIARGIIDLALYPDYDGPAVEFAHFPARTAYEADQKRRFGENALESMADRTQLARVLDGTLAIGAGAALIPLYLVPNDFQVDAIGVFVLLGGSLSIVSGIVTLVVESVAEDRWDAYQTLDARLRDGEMRSEAERGVRLRVGATPLPAGAAVTVAAEF